MFKEIESNMGKGLGSGFEDAMEQVAKTNVLLNGSVARRVMLSAIGFQSRNFRSMTQ